MKLVTQTIPQSHGLDSSLLKTRSDAPDVEFDRGSRRNIEQEDAEDVEPVKAENLQFA